MRPKALILHATGTNRDLEAAQAFEVAGANAEIVHINQLRSRERLWHNFQLLVLPGGFSYADSLGAGKLLALDLLLYFSAEIQNFIESGKPVIGICNGFQALVKSGILPDQNFSKSNPSVTLTFNSSGHFECRWVCLLPISDRCIWTRGLTEPIECPVAHGEGNFQARDPKTTFKLSENNQIALIYADKNGQPARGCYPYNPNGSVLDIAGICNPQGNVLGLMPHPEDHIFTHQHPNWTQKRARHSGLPIFRNGVEFAAET